MKDASIWGAMLGLSAALHAGLTVLVLSTFTPHPVAHRPTPPAEMALSTLNVPRSTANEAPPQQDATRSQALDSEDIGTQPIPKNSAFPKKPIGTVSSLLETVSVNAPNALPWQPTLPETRPEGQNTAANTLPKASVIFTQADNALVPNLKLPMADALAVKETSPSAPSLAPASSAASNLSADALKLAKATSPAKTAQTLDTPATAINSLRTNDQKLAEDTARATAAIEAAIKSERAQTVLAWSGTLSLEVPQNTLDTAAALRLPPSNTDTQGLRDALETSLDSVNCARVQTVYDPETGAIDLRGHVRNETDRIALLTAVSKQLGGSLPIQDKLQRLGAPQCNVLVQLSKMPLPQSVEQLINPLIIGADLQTRSYSFTNGRAMKFDLVGAEYDGWIYLDYYDNKGQVLHLLPNAYIPPLFLKANAPLAFGDGSSDDPTRGKFEMRVSPPFGQDIVVAMISNKPLFEVRPTVENAEAYLVDLAAKVSELRERTADFKGEWVYLFVETLPDP